MMRNALLSAAMVVLVAACGAYRFPGSPSAGTGSVSGRVLAVPCAPVQKQGDVCTGRPVGGLQITFQNGSDLETVTTDSAGRYSMALKEGTWNVSLKTYMRIISGPPTVTVSAGFSVVANYMLDSGIRVPVPAAAPQGTRLISRSLT